MSKLRDEIAEIIQTIDEPWLAADDILATMREALLSDEAVKAAVRAQFDDGDELDDESFTESSTPGQPGYGWVGHLKGIWVDQITAALDAVTGEGDR